MRLQAGFIGRFLGEQAVGPRRVTHFSTHNATLSTQVFFNNLAAPTLIFEPRWIQLSPMWDTRRTARSGWGLAGPASVADSCTLGHFGCSERIALHQTRLRTPGLGLEARASPWVRRLVLLPSLDRLVARLSVYTRSIRSRI